MILPFYCKGDTAGFQHLRRQILTTSESGTSKELSIHTQKTKEIEKF